MSTVPIFNNMSRKIALIRFLPTMFQFCDSLYHTLFGDAYVCRTTTHGKQVVNRSCSQSTIIFANRAAWGYLRAKASGIGACPSPLFKSASCCRRTCRR